MMKYNFVITFLLIILFNSCKKDTEPKTIDISINKAYNIATSHATVDVSVSDLSYVKSIHVRYSNFSDFSNSSTCDISADKIANKVSLTLNALSSNTKYYYQAYIVTEDNSYIYSNEIQELSSDNKFTIITDSVSDITSSSASVYLSVSDTTMGFTDIGVIYDTIPTELFYKEKAGSFNTKKAMSVSYYSTLTDLSAGKTYYCRVYSSDGSNYYYGNILQFSTKTSYAAIIPGKGLQNADLNGTWSQIKSVFGNKYDVKYNYISSNRCYYYNLYYSNIGVGFIFNPTTTYISSIEEAKLIYVYSPYKGQTAKGISIGSSMNSVKLVYGTPESTDKGDGYYSYTYSSIGITFFADNSNKVNEMDIFTSSKKNGVLLDSKKLKRQTKPCYFK